MPVVQGAIEGGVTAVLAKSFFAGAVEAHKLNLAVAVLAGAPSFANLVSFLWAAASHGRDKVRVLATLQAATAACAGAVAFSPRNEAGLWILMAGAVGAHVCWTGVVALRTTLWLRNYPRHTRARLAGRLATVQALTMTIVGAGIGLAMKLDDQAFRLLYPAAAACGFAAAWISSGLRVRGHRSLLHAERSDVAGAIVNPLRLRRLLLDDASFGRYMTCMFLFGTGNLMVAAPVVIMLRDRFSLGPLRSILIATSIPTLLMPISIPVWSRLLDRVHVVRFRAIHSWAFVASTAAMLAGAVSTRIELLWLGAALKGVANGGGVLSWNLGHHDFAPPERAAQYMGLHMTLTGVRGLIAPVIGVCLYEILQWLHPGSGPWALALPLALSAAGAAWFVGMRRDLTGPGGIAAFSESPPVQPPAAA